MRIFLDANILFSGSLPGSLLSVFINELQRHARVLTNAYAKTEAERNLASKFPKGLVGLRKLAASMEVIPLQLFDLEVSLAEKDRPILCGAIAGKADFLLTGDRRDFGRLFGKSVGGVKILTVELLIKELAGRGILEF